MVGRAVDGGAPWLSAGSNSMHPQYSPFERFFSKVQVVPDSCWPWTGARVGGGYGWFAFQRGKTRRKGIRAHRLAYAIATGILNPTLTIDHLCRNRACQNPDHMELVPGRTNTLRGISPPAQNARQNWCQRGHPFDLFNTHYRKTDGRRMCKACQAWKQREKRRELRALGLGARNA